MKHKLWLIGAGPMGIEYAKVLSSLGISFITIGRGEESASIFKEKTGCEVIIGGIEAFAFQQQTTPDFAIVATGVESLMKSTLVVIKKGIRKILIEKPGGINFYEINKIKEVSKDFKTDVYLAYNRRFYASVLKAQELIESDGGVKSIYYEFTEWANTIDKIKKGMGIKEKWFLANSTHVVDLAFFLGGTPLEFSCYTNGRLPWHPSASIFTGAGITDKNVLFSYQANWESPGRWGIEVLTKSYRLFFKPLEKLQIQKLDSMNIDYMEIDDKLDNEFKPGLYLQTEAFINNNHINLLTIKEQADRMPIYNRIAAYKD